MIHLSSTRTPVETLESTPASARVPTACLTLDCIQNGFAHTVVCSTFAHVRDDILLLNVDVVLSSVDGFDPGRVVGNIIPHRHETMAPSNERPGISNGQEPRQTAPAVATVPVAATAPRGDPGAPSLCQRMTVHRI